MNGVTPAHSGSCAEPRLLHPVVGRTVVYFPLVGAGTSSMGSLECMQWAIGGGRRFMVSHPRFGGDVEQILADARFNETGEHSEKCVRVRFAPSDFSGTSYGLALALGDKAARQAGKEEPPRQIYATGRIIADGHGAVGPINHFEAKLALVERAAQAGDLFLFPQDNFNQLDDGVRRRLAQFGEQSGIGFRPVGHVDDLDDLFAIPDDGPTVAAQRGVTVGAGATVIAIALLGTGAVWYALGETADPAAAFPLKVQAFFGRAGHTMLQPLTATSELRAGDRYRLRFSLANGPDRHVYILQTDGSDEVFCLYPITTFSGTSLDHVNPARAGQYYDIPAADQSFELDDKTGRETLQFFAHKQSHPLLTRFCASGQEPAGGIGRWLVGAPESDQRRLSFRHVD